MPLEILEFYTDSSTRDMGTFIDIEMQQYMLLMYNSIKNRGFNGSGMYIQV